MEYSEDHIALAAEYALGTLDADERAQVESMMSVDSEFTAIVRAWEYRLGALNQMVGSIEPPPELWERIRTAIELTGQPQEPLVLSEPPPIVPLAQISEAVAALQASVAAPPPPPEPPPLQPPSPEPPSVAVASEPPVDNSNVIQLTGRVRSYRNLAVAMTAIAAALLAV